MNIKIVQIGNSKGIRIPKSVLEDCNIGDSVQLSVEEGRIILNPTKKPREGWSESFKMMHQKDHDKLLIDDSIDIDHKDWSW